MNVKLAVVLAVACLFLAGVCFASDNNKCDNDKQFVVTDKVYNNNRVVVTWGKRGGKVRVHSLFAPRKWVQIAHVRVQELTKDKAPVYLKNSKGKSTNQLRAVNLADTDFTWSTPTVVDGAEGRTVDAYLRTQFQVAGSTSTKVIFRVNVVQENSVQVLNGVTLRREVDDVQFSLDIVDWPFESDTNVLDWQFYVKTNYDPVDKKADGTVTKSKILKVPGVPGTGTFVFKNAIITYPNNAQVDGVNKPCSAVVTDVDNKGDYTLDVYFPKAAHHLFYNAIVKMINLPPGSGDPGNGGGCPAGQTCTPPCSATQPCPTDPCAAQPAPCNGGTCTNQAGVPVCSNCPAGTTGYTCSKHNQCVDNVCLNGASCTPDMNTGAAICTCVGGWTGSTCNIPPPCYNGGSFCSSHGSCQNGVCQCTGDWDGSACQTDLCTPNPCQNGGTCSRGVCTCPSGWQGAADCSVATCSVNNPCNGSPDPCNGHGTCSCSGNSQTSCACTNGWTSGASGPCTVDPCQSPGAIQCQNGATCQYSSTGVTSCTACPSGFTGADCGTAIPNPCANNPCQNGGSCSVSSSNTAVCACADGYSSGSAGTCEIDLCAPGGTAWCHNGGQCIRAPGAVTCQCTIEYVGPNPLPPHPSDPQCDQLLMTDIMGKPVTEAQFSSDYLLPPPTFGSGAFGYFTTSNSLVVFYPNYGAMRLYDITGITLTSFKPNTFHLHADMELDQTTAEFLATADFIQLTQAALVETDPSKNEIASRTFALDGGHWQYDRDGSTPDFIEQFVYKRSAVSPFTGGIIDFMLKVQLYTQDAKSIYFGDAGSYEGDLQNALIDVPAGALKFSVFLGPWPFMQPQGDHPFVKWITYLRSREQVAAFIGAQQLPDGQIRFAIPQGNYDAHPTAVACANSCSQIDVSQEFDAGYLATKIVHWFPFYGDWIQYDPVIKLRKPDEPDYPPYVAPDSPTGASVIRDPRSQFQGAATLHVSALAVVFAALAGFLAALV